MEQSEYKNSELPRSSFKNIGLTKRFKTIKKI